MQGKKTIYKVGNKITEYLTYLGEDEYYITPKGGAKVRRIKAKCVCGNIISVVAHSVASGKTKSCGCQKSQMISQNHTTFGHSKHPLYRTWSNQRHRCLNPKIKSYKNYGDRGIEFNEEFLDFKVWLKYVESLPNYENRKSQKLTLDRIDNDGNYEKGNLRWANLSTQRRNRREKIRYCSVDRCQRKHKANGYCSIHYYQFCGGKEKRKKLYAQEHI